MPDITPTPQQDAIAAFLQSCRELGAALDRIAERFRLERERLASASHLAAAGSEPAVGWSAKAKAALELSAAAQAHGWAALDPEQKTQVGSNNAHMIVAHAIAGVRDMIKGWAEQEDEPIRQPAADDSDLPWLRLALDHAILNDPNTGKESGDREWVRVEDAARIAATWICDNRQRICGGDDNSTVRTEDDGCICVPAEGRAPFLGLLCPVHGDPISRKNLPPKPWIVPSAGPIHAASKEFMEETKAGGCICRWFLATGEWRKAGCPVHEETQDMVLRLADAYDEAIRQSGPSIDRNRDYWPLRTRHLDGSHKEWGAGAGELLQRMWVLINTATDIGRTVEHSLGEKWHEVMVEVAYAYDQWREIHHIDTHIITAYPLTLGPKPKQLYRT